MTGFRQAVRRLLRTPGFTLTSVLTLAIGIGATIAIFAVVNGVLIKPLPFPDSERLVALTHGSEEDPDADLPASTAIYFTYREHSRAFESVALWLADTANVTAPGDPEEVHALIVTFEFFPTLGVFPALGRAFVEEDDRPDSMPTVILGHGYWQRRFGGAEDVLGQDLVVDGVVHRIIGILPRDFRFLQRPADIVLPMRPIRALSFVGPLGENGIARLKNGFTLDDANADVGRMIPLVKETFSPVPGIDPEVFEGTWLLPNVKPLKATFVGDLDDVLLVLLGTIGLLLAVACANVANLELVRAERRAQDLAIEAALGATRTQLALSILRESVVVGLTGGAVGLGFAALALPVLLAMAGDELPAVLTVTIDRTVIAAAVAVSLAAGIVFGAVPALRYAGSRPAGALRVDRRRHSMSRERHRLHRGLIAAQVALALMLLVAAGLMMRSLASLLDVDPGFVAPDEVQTFTVSLPQGSVPDFQTVIRMFNRMQDAIASLAGVESVGFGTRIPLAEPGPSAGFLVEGSEDPDPPESEFRVVSPGFLETLGTPVIAGRTFEWADHLEPRPVAIVSAGFARREWGSPEAAIGKRLSMVPSGPWREVIGVVGDIRHESLDGDVPSSVYLTLGENWAPYMSRTVAFAIRSERVGTAGFLQELYQAIWSVDPSVPLGNIATLGDIYTRATARAALILVLVAIAGGMALVLGLVGIYGVIGYMLAQRTHEIGIRMALGAEHAALRRMLLRQISWPVFVGVALGLAGAVGLSRLIESLLFGVHALDPQSYVLATLVLVATAAVAAYLPARRVAGIDPAGALRAE